MNDLSEMNWICKELGLSASHIRNFKLAQEMNFLDSLNELLSIYIDKQGKVQPGDAIRWAGELFVIASCWGNDIGANCYVLTTDGTFLDAQTIEKV